MLDLATNLSLTRLVFKRKIRAQQYFAKVCGVEILKLAMEPEET